MKDLKIHTDYPLKALNTFGVDVQAAHYTEVTSEAQLQALLDEPQWQQTSKMILGGGSNVLFTQDFPGLMIKNNILGTKIIKEDEDHVWLSVGAGENWHDFVMYCIDHHYAGIENLSLIPGTVGAAPMQNIGAYGTEIKDCFDTLSAIHIEDGTSHQFNNSDCEFGYRDSVFKRQLKNQFAITSVTLRLNKQPAFNTSYGAITKMLDTMNVKDLSIRAISDAVISLRQQKLPDPKKIGNAGSFFKNPFIPQTHFETIKQQYPDIPHHSITDDTVKIPAAWLIEQCGWKGKRCGNTGVHEQQALVIVNHNNADGISIRKLSEDIQESVLEKFKIQLESEVNII